MDDLDLRAWFRTASMEQPDRDLLDAVVQRIHDDSASSVDAVGAPRPTREWPRHHWTAWGAWGFTTGAAGALVGATVAYAVLVRQVPPVLVTQESPHSVVPPAEIAGPTGPGARPPVASATDRARAPRRPGAERAPNDTTHPRSALKAPLDRPAAQDATTLKDARQALAAGNGEVALTLLDTSPRTVLSEDGALLRIEALAATRQYEAAETSARTFALRFPDSRHLSRVRALEVQANAGAVLRGRH